MTRKEQVTKIIDGDTFQTKSRVHSVRLANVDAPERGTKGGATATAALRKMIGGQQVTVDTVASDKYGRAVANVKVGAKSVNTAMRRKGYR